jgi:hypothetical protein
MEADRSANSFFDNLRAFESGISLDQHDWYVQNLDKRVLKYPEVISPGRLLRDSETGLHQLIPMTIKEYFLSLGVHDLFDIHDKNCLKKMQYCSINPWGYVGYQFGEECLSDIGYYTKQKCHIDIENDQLDVIRYYRGGLEPTTWKDDRTEILLEEERVILTDVNRWQGSFTGKNGVYRFEDLKSPYIQEIIIREAMRANFNQLSVNLNFHNTSVESCMKREWEHNDTLVKCSISGILACCHLLGPNSTSAFLISSEIPSDDLGTSVLDYMSRFGHYDLSSLNIPM